MSDEAVIVKGNGSLFLAGPPLVKVTPSTWSVVSLLYIPTSHPAFCLMIKQKYCLSHQKIGKSLLCTMLYILNGHTAFSIKTTPQI